MKALFRRWLRKAGLWYPLLHVRQIPAVVGWIRSGCASAPPHIVKLQVCRAYARAFHLRVFVETGTYLGETAEWMARAGLRVWSIELDKALHEQARRRLAGYPRITLVQGDSAKVLPQLLEGIHEPALFWLDAHWSRGITAKGAVDSPVASEMAAILQHDVPGHVILVDDARFFLRRDGYPYLEDLLSKVRASRRYKAEVSTDIIRVVPPCVRRGS